MTTTPIEVTIRLSEEVEGSKRGVFFNGSLSHHIHENDLKGLLAGSKSQLWKTDLAKGADMGKDIYRLLNGSGGGLQKLIDQSFDTGNPLHLYLNVPSEFDTVPFELIYNNHFLLLEGDTSLIRRVNEKNRRKVIPPEKRILKIIFMACSPLGLKSDEILSFEKEEELILANIEKFPVSITVEDSGSRNGLAELLFEMDGADIVHISGHAGIDPKLGPVFYMENDIGELEKVTPDLLWKSLKDFPPRLLFLSGCSTAGTDKLNTGKLNNNKDNAAESFASQMVDKGISTVLGWGLPVSDNGATIFAGGLYEVLAKGKCITEAVSAARKKINDLGHYHPWPLLRTFNDGMSFTPLIAPGQKLQRTTTRKAAYKYLTDNKVRVLEKGFVGRRREVQRGVRTLKGAIEGRYGIIIHGTAGIGKSCLAGKLIDRFHQKELVVIHGVITVADLFQKLDAIFDRKGTQSGIEILKSNMETEDKIKALFRTAFQELPVLLYFDDFEQNLERRGNEYHVKPEAINIIEAVLTALDWSEGATNLIITSRYPFILEHNGIDLPKRKLEDVPLMSFTGADLEKKKNELKYISQSENSSLYMEGGKGNPRLLEWMEIIAEDEGKYDIRDLTREIKGKNEEFISKYLAEVLAKTEGEKFHTFLHKSSVFRQPVEFTAFEEFGTKGLAQTGVNLTLFESEELPGRDPIYWVTPVLREQMWDYLTTDEKTEMHCLAYKWYDQTIGTNKEPDYKYIEEAVFHGLESKNIRGACKHAIVLGNYLEAMVLYRERVQLQLHVAEMITDEVIEEAINEKDGNVAGLMNELGYGLNTLGKYEKAIEYYERALGSDLKTYGPDHPDVAIDWNNLGGAWRSLGEYEKAIEYYEKALESDLKTYGPDHPQVAIYWNNLGAAWDSLGKYEKAIEYYEKALASDLKTYGPDHPDVAIDWNNLGGVWKSLGEYEKAIEYFERALESGLKTYGPDHPKIALRWNNLGVAWDSLGKNEKAIEYYEKALASDLKTYGPDHPKVALRWNNLGVAWNSLGKYEKAIEYFERALESDLKTYGPDHPDVAFSWNNLGGAWDSLGEYEKAIEYFERALASDLKTCGPEHPNVAIDWNNLGEAWRSLGKYEKAIEYYERALASDLKTYGPDHPQVAIYWNNLGMAWKSLGKYEKAIEYHEKALKSDLKTYGPDHPSVARSWNNLGMVWDSLGKYEKAIKYYEKSLESDLKTYGPGHPKVAIYWNNLGGAWDSLGKYEKAIEYFERALESDLKTYSPDHLNVAIAWNNLGSVWNSLGKYELAIEYYEKGFTIFQKKLGQGHPKTKVIFNNLENAIRLFTKSGKKSKDKKMNNCLISVYKKLIDGYLFNGKWLMAYEVAGKTIKLLNLLKRAPEILDIYEKLWKNLNENLKIEEKTNWLPHIGNFCLVYGKALKKNKRWNDALPLLKKAKDIFKNTGNREGMASVCLELGGLFEIFNDYDLSRWTYKDALRFGKQLKQESKVAITKANLARLEIKTGLINDAVNHLEDALKYFRKTQNIDKVNQVRQILEIANNMQN